jgi:hypothetical protein
MLTEWLRDARGVRKERARRRQDFQRETLLQLQDALQQLAGSAGSFGSSRAKRAAQTGEWPGPEDLVAHYDALFDARLQVIATSSRVEDETVRTLTTHFLELESQLSSAGNEQDARALYAGLPEALVPLMERIGEQVRGPAQA